MTVKIETQRIRELVDEYIEICRCLDSMSHVLTDGTIEDHEGRAIAIKDKLIGKHGWTPADMDSLMVGR